MRKNKISILALALLIILAMNLSCGHSTDNRIRIHEKFNAAWKFTKGDIKNAQAFDFDDSNWRLLDLPHDWAIEGPFSKEVYFQGGYLPYPGVGWYRKTFKYNQLNKIARLEFDGVMMNAKVWVNGEFTGEWAFGYSSFAFDITRFLKPNQDNVIAVRVENMDYSSRWYPGSGIYRNVWLTLTDPVHVAHWGTYVTTPEISKDKAEIKIETSVQNEGDKNANIILETSIVDHNGKVVSDDSQRGEIRAQKNVKLVQNLTIKTPRRWDVGDPYLYKVISRIIKDGKVIDDYETPLGIRTFRFDADKGFFLNGRSLKIKGVNMHHDLGPLGSAVYTRAIERQLEIMKEMGVNAIRTAHNPPAPEQLDLCDRMGILVMDESFDEWRKPKWNVLKSYSTLFDEWAEKDMRALVLRDRNHPSVILWSTGNEVPELGTGKVRVFGGLAGEGTEIHYDQQGQLVKFEEWDGPRFGRYDGKVFTHHVTDHEIHRLTKAKQAPSLSGTTWDIKGFKGDNAEYRYEFWDDLDGKNSAKMLADICHELDPTRPVSSGIHLSIRLDKELMDIFEVGGFNYWHEKLEDLHKTYPEKPLLVTEASATLSSRGEYFFPVERIYHGWQHESQQISSYDLINTGFGALPDVEFKLQDDFEWLAGQFVWSGFDYHGEPDPYENAWPAHSSYFGIVDMCGFPKDRYYLYQSAWTDEPMIHVLPHWNWEGREGEITPVYCYTNCTSAELFVNGESRGKKEKASGEYRLRWDDVVYQPGFIKAVGYDEQGDVLCEKEIRTAENPFQIELIPDRKIIRADGEDLSFITVRITDNNGHICPKADNLVTFQIEGEGTITAVGNGNPISHESYQAPQRKAFHGLCLVVLKSKKKEGTIRLSASSSGLKSDTTEIKMEN
jgi:beta-galactosidase